MMDIKQFLNDQVLSDCENLMDKHCPDDGSGVNRLFLLRKSGLIPTMVRDGILPDVVLNMRDLSAEEFKKFKDGKKLPDNFPFPKENEIVTPGQDYLGACYEWYKGIQKILDGAADLIVMPVILGITKKFVSRRGANGGICRALETSPADSSTEKAKSKTGNSEWSDIGLPDNFLDNLQKALNACIPPGAINSLTAKQVADFMKIDLTFSSKVSQAIRLGKVTGYASVQNKGIVRIETVKHKEKKKPSEKKAEDAQLTDEFDNLSFSDSEASNPESPDNKV